MEWHGVFPAITTPFCEDLSVDIDFFAEHIDAMIGAGCRGLVALGSLAKRQP